MCVGFNHFLHAFYSVWKDTLSIILILFSDKLGAKISMRKMISHPMAIKALPTNACITLVLPFALQLPALIASLTLH
ncbi:hypothetical protein P618_200384 [Holospora obtusa F1]|uniref:Uncharacterized protein n=1 Tax=Holospora obtusa F1 TaxID=1399147 RepID=W6THM2_HOLOB|nr:hypothetical protein P618_200384 [Holospora obtusa F1]